MKQTTLNDDVRDLFTQREELISKLNEVERQLAMKRRLLIRHREVETAAHDVFGSAERRCACGR